MDFGDLIFLVMIGIGLLSSVFGKKPDAKAKRQRQRQQLRTSSERPASSPSRPVVGPRRDVASAMQDILRELQIVPPEDEPSVPQPVPEPRTRQPAVRGMRPPPEPRSAKANAAKGWQEAVDQKEAVALGAESHRKFHDAFVTPLKKPRKRQGGAARVRRLMTRSGLRDAILAQEILGPPKSMQ